MENIFPMYIDKNLTTKKNLGINNNIGLVKKYYYKVTDEKRTKRKLRLI